MDPNRENNPLLLRALETSGGEPACDLSQRIMARVERRAAQRARWSKAGLFAGATLGGLVILGLGIWTIRQISDISTFTLSTKVLPEFGRILRETFASAGPITPEERFLTGFYSYIAVVFLSLSLLGEWMRRRFGSGSTHQ